ncbi:putative dimethylaniline monooxygenase, partial [Apostichopus japonicus]
MVVQSVLIIGAGAGGLAAIKTCLEEGLEPTCFEMKPDIGGLWLLDESFERDAWRRQTLITNTSREMTGFSDFPFPRDAPPFLTGKDVLRYYQKYAERFNLRPYIHCNSEVTKLEQNTDNKKWCVEVSKPGVGTKDYTFDAVLICCGRRQTYIPHYPGLETFKGTVTHSELYRSNADIDDKKVLVVGASHSAGDVAVHASNNASQ